MTYPYTDSDQLTVLESVVTLLRDALDLNERRCYLTLPDLDEGQMPPGGDYFIEVAPGDGRAIEDFQIGGGAHQSVEQSVVEVTIFNRIKLDSANKAKSLLEAYKRGLWRVQKKVLAALVDKMPTDDAGNYFLVNPFYYRGSTRPRYDKQTGIAKLTVLVGADWDWGTTLDTALADDE